MRQINLTLLKKTTLHLLPYIGILILATMIYFKVNENDKLASKVESQKLEAKIYAEKANSYQKEAIQLQKQLPKLKESVIALENSNRLKDAQIDLLKDKVKEKLSEVSRYTPNEIALYYQKRYNDKKGVVLTQYGVALTDTVAKKSITELTLFDGSVKELGLTKDKLATTDKIVVVKDSIIGNIESQNSKLNLAIQENDKALNAKDNVIKNSEKMFRKERNKKNFWKTTTGAVIGAAIYLIFK